MYISALLARWVSGSFFWCQSRIHSHSSKSVDIIFIIAIHRNQFVSIFPIHRLLMIRLLSTVQVLPLSLSTNLYRFYVLLRMSYPRRLIFTVLPRLNSIVIEIHTWKQWISPLKALYYYPAKQTSHAFDTLTFTVLFIALQS
jgi:hypothetical protein